MRHELPLTLSHPQNSALGRRVEVILYSDGACSRNPGPGGWAYILHHVSTGKEIEASGSEDLTTNNRMELQAVIEGLKQLKRRVCVHVITDSAYLKRGITDWIENWKCRGWRRKASGGLQPVKNAELWKTLDKLVQWHRVTFELVRGHSGHPQNERCDELAVGAYKALIE